MHIDFETFVLCPNGRRMFVDSLDSRGLALLTRGRIHPVAREVWVRLLNEAAWDHIIDVGANYGEMLVDAELPDAAILAIEPSPRVLPYLRATLEHAGIPAEVWPIAVSSHDGEAVLEVDRTWSGNSALLGARLRPAGHQFEDVTVPTVTMATLLARLAVRQSARVLLKVDVEGNELTALRGLLSSIGRVSLCAALVEVVRMHVGDLDWIARTFNVRLFDLAGERLVDAGVDSGRALEALLLSGRYYQRDIVLGLPT